MENVSKNDFLFFQNDILKDIKALESTMNNKISQINQTILSKINDQESKLSRQTDNINELLSIYASRKHDNEKIEQLLSMKSTINDSLLDCKTQINLVNRCINNAISKYDTIIIDNLSLPGIVGMNCKFRNFREYLEFIYSELKANKLFKEQQLLNAKRYKEKLENLIKKEEAELKEVTNKTNKICEAKFHQYEKIMEDKFNLTQELVQAQRIENSKYAMDLINKTEELEISYERLKEIKKEIYDEFEQELVKFRKEVEINTKIFTKNQNDFKLLKQRFTQLSEFIKDIRFQKNIRNFSKMARDIDFNKKQKFKDDYNMELYNEITKDLLTYLNGEKDEGEKNQNTIKRSRTNRRTSSVMFNQINKEQIKKSILNKFRNSSKLDLNKFKKLDMNKASPIRKKRNSMVYQQNEFNEMKKKMIFDTTIKEEENSSQRKKSKFDDIKESNEKDKDKNAHISFSQSDKSSSSSSSSSSLYSSKTITNSKKEKEEKKDYNKTETKTKTNVIRNLEKEMNSMEEQKSNQKEIKNDINNRRGSNQQFRTIKLQSKNDKIKKNNKKGKERKMSKIDNVDPHIKEIKEEYGNKAKLMSMDLVASTHYKPKYSNNELTLFNAQNMPLIAGSGQGNNPLRKTTTYFSNKNLNIITNNNLFINRQTNNNNNNNNSILPNLLTYSSNKKDKILLLFQNNTNNKGKNNNNICTTNLNINKDKNTERSNKSNKNVIIPSLLDKNNNNNNIFSSPKPIKNKNTLLNNVFTVTKLSHKTDGINYTSRNNHNNHNKKFNEKNEEYSNHIFKDIKILKSYYYSKELIIQNIDKFLLEKSKIKEEFTIKKTNNLAIIKTNTANKNTNTNKKNYTNNDIDNDIDINYSNNNNNNVNPFNVYDLQLIDNEFEKEKNQQNFIHIKQEINKINESNEELNIKINGIEDKYSPMVGQMDEIFKLMSLIYDTIKKDFFNQSMTVVQTLPNINKTDSNRIKIDTKIRNRILKDYINKKGINLTFPVKKDNNNLTIEKNKPKINEENSKSIGNTEYIKIPKDDMNLLLHKIEPFLIKKFSQ